MPKPEPPLRPATSEELEQALSFALRFKGRKRVHSADDGRDNRRAPGRASAGGGLCGDEEAAGTAGPAAADDAEQAPDGVGIHQTEEFRVTPREFSWMVDRSPPDEG